MAAKVLNIEVCDQTISVCRTAQKGKSVQIFDSFLFPTPDGCVSDGVILNAPLLANELKKQLSVHGIPKTRNVVFALLSSKIAVREVKLPPMKRKLISTAIRTNSEDYFPIDLKNYHITYSVLDTASSAKPYNRILVMAAPISMLEGYFLLADKAGLNVKAIDSSGNSQYQALKCIEYKGVTVYVDVGSSSSVVSFIRERKLLLQRTFAFGAGDLLSHYMSVSGKPHDNYLELLNETNITHPDFMADKLLSLADIQTDLERLVSGLMRSIDYFNSSQWDAAASRVVLVGINRHILGLKELVAESTGLETLYLDEISEFSEFTNGAAEASTYINCIGSSLDPLDLIPKQFLPARRITIDDESSSVVPGVIMCGIIVFGAILISLSSWLGYASTVNDLQNIQAEVNSLQPAKQMFGDYVAYQNTQQAVNALAAQTKTPNAQLVAFFKELEEKMPSSILLLSAACTNNGVALNITVGSYTDAASVISSLRSFKSIAVVETNSLSSSENEAGDERVAFSVICIYGANPYLNKINPYGELLNPSEQASDTTAAASADMTTGLISDTASAALAQ